MADTEIKLGMTEHDVFMPIVNPDTGAKSRTFRYAGKIDRIEDGVVIDWKSCADPARFIMQLKLGWQAYLYAMALEYIGVKIDEIQYRLIRKPTIKFCGKDTDVAAYEDRCFEWLVDDSRRLVDHSFLFNSGKMQQAQAWLWGCGKRLLECRQHDRWLANEHACYQWERECPYMPLCEALADGADVEWVKQQDYQQTCRHPEIMADDENVLTYSSLSVLTACELKYYWRHELGLRKRLDYAESLWLGNAMHVGLDAYAKGGSEAAGEAISAWERANPSIGDDVRYVQQQVAKARAMVRAAAEKWPFKETPDG